MSPNLTDCMDGNGRVFIFNTWDKSATLQLNGAVLGTCAAFVEGSGPGVIANAVGGVCRYPAPSLNGVAQFASSNTLIIQRGSEMPDSFDIEIDPTQYDISDDLQLYIFDNNIALVSAGKLVGGGLISSS